MSLFECSVILLKIKLKGFHKNKVCKRFQYVFCVYGVRCNSGEQFFYLSSLIEALKYTLPAAAITTVIFNYANAQIC
jgi:hypothetical protein